MPSAVNPTAKSSIIKAAVALAAKRDIDKLTVIEIADEAHIARRTFYDNFKDIPDLMQYILNQAVAEMIRKSTSVQNTSDVFDLFLDEMELGYPVLSRILSSRYRAAAEEKLLDAFKEVIGNLIVGRPSKLKLRSDHADFIVDVISCMTLAYFLEHYSKRDIDPQKIKAIMLQMERDVEDAFANSHTSGDM